MTAIKLEPNTIKTLRTFARMNSGIVIRPGNTIHTIDYRRQVFGKAVVRQTFDREIAINNLPQILSMGASSTITIEGERIAIQDASMMGGKFSFPLARPEHILTPPTDKEPRFPSDVDTRFDLPQDKLQAIQKALKPKKHQVFFSNVVVTGADGKVMLTASRRNFRDVEDRPVFELRIGDTDKEFKVSLLMENLQMLMPCDYSVEVSYRMGVEGLKALGHFAAPDMDYWMTVEEADCIPVNRELWRQREVAAARAKEQKADLTETIKKLSEDEIVRVRAFIQELDSKPQQQETA